MISSSTPATPLQSKATSNDYDLVGNVISADFQRIRKYLEDKETSTVPRRITPMIPADYLDYRGSLKSLISSPKQMHYLTKDYILLDHRRSPPFVSLQEFQKTQEAAPISTDNGTLEALGREEFNAILKSRNRPIVQMDISIGDRAVGQLVLELFDDIASKTARHFLDYVEGKRVAQDGTSLKYDGTQVTRILPQGWIQAGGKIEIKDQSGSLIREGFLPDENFIIPHDKSGILSMVNSGPHSNYSSFMITNGPLPYFDRKYVAFGRLIQGQATLDRINGVKTRLERPTEAITITSAKLVDL